MYKNNVRWVSLFLALVFLCGLMITPAWAADTAQPAITWTGTWDAGPIFGTMTLVQTGTSVAGTYTQNKGQILGSVSGSQLTATWLKAPSYKPPNDSGLVMMVMSVDGKTATGVWSYGVSDTRSSFTATRTTPVPNQKAKVEATLSASNVKPGEPITITYDMTPGMSGDYILCFRQITNAQSTAPNNNFASTISNALNYQGVDVAGEIKRFTNADLINGHYKGQVTVTAPNPDFSQGPQSGAATAQQVITNSQGLQSPFSGSSTQVRSASFEFAFIGPKEKTSSQDSSKELIGSYSVTINESTTTQPATTTPGTTTTGTTSGTPTGTKTGNIISLGVGNPNMNINGTGCAIDPGKGTSPTVVSGRVFLPIRSIVEVMGGTVQWNAGEKKLTVISGSTTIDLWIGRNVARVKGKDSPLSAAPFVSGSGRTMLPLRFVTDNLGCQSAWDPNTKSVKISFDGPVHLPSAESASKNQAATGLWSGTWETNLGTLTLTQKGSRLTGTSDDGTRLTGTASGDTAQGTWTDEDGSGTFTFTMAPDQESFKGEFTTQGDDETYEWNGTKK
ncbi:MAG: copper amine oxidase N-terminal domain-containing protein [Candidatus Saccharibacteria bacterium]